MLRIITDSAADFEPEELAALNIDCIPLDVSFGDRNYQENLSLSKPQFYRLLREEKDFPRTSHPGPYVYERRMREAKAAGDSALFITISSAISGTYQTAQVALQESGTADCCAVVDAKTATGGQRMLVELAVRLRDEGKSLPEVVEAVEALRPRTRIFACMNTLEYLYRGGRIPKAAYALGTAANIKPMITVARDGSVQVIAKMLGLHRGMAYILKKFREDPPDMAYPIYFMYTGEPENGRKLMEYMNRSGENFVDNRVIPVGAAIGSHVGPGACGMVYIAKKQQS